MKLFHILAITFFIIIFSISPNVQANIVERDLYSAGDKLVTLDTNTGLEWLDISQTKNLYFPYVQLFDQGNLQAAGWELATENEIETFLYGNTGLAEGSFGIGPAGNETKSLMEAFGILYDFGDVYPFYWRDYIIFDDQTDNGWVGRAEIQVTFDYYMGNRTVATAKWLADSDCVTNSNSGGPIFFVRESTYGTPTPEPSTMILFGVGLLAFVACGRSYFEGSKNQEGKD